MGEVADSMLDGTLCEGCGDLLGDPTGHPRRCRNCGGTTKPMGEMGKLERFAQRGMAAQKAVDTEIAKHYGPGPWLVITSKEAPHPAVCQEFKDAKRLQGECWMAGERETQIISVSHALAAEELLKACALSMRALQGPTPLADLENSADYIRAAIAKAMKP